MNDAIVDVVLTAYRGAAVELVDVVDDAGALLERLGDVNRQVSDPRIEVRFGLAGRLLAASHLAAEQAYSDVELRAMIRGWMSRRRAELEDAAPSRDRVRVEDDVIDDLDALIEDEAAHSNPAYAYALAAGLILELMERPEIDMERSLALRDDLAHLAEDALAIVEQPTPRGLSSMFFEERLGALHLRAHPDGPVRKELTWAEEPWTGWLWIVAAAAAVHRSGVGESSRTRCSAACGWRPSAWLRVGCRMSRSGSQPNPLSRTRVTSRSTRRLRVSVGCSGPTMRLRSSMSRRRGSSCSRWRPAG